MIREKRDSLERFIREQMEGPGACGNHFYCTTEEPNDIGQNEEVLNTTPGSVYSTAVLFPQRKQKSNNDEATFVSLPETDQETNLSNSSEYQIAQDDNNSEEFEEERARLDSDEEDLYSISQRFPTTIGVSCCLNKQNESILSSDVNIILSGRYYTKISKGQFSNIVIKIDDFIGFSQFFEANKSKLSSYFALAQDGVKLVEDIPNDNIGNIKDLLLLINKKHCGSIAKNNDGTQDSEYLAIGDNYRYLKSYKERLWRKLKFFKDKYLSEEERKIIDSRIDELEKCETYLSYLEDTMNICNSKSFGFWRSHTFSKKIDLSGVDFNAKGNKIIYSPREIKEFNMCLLDTKSYNLNLSVWLQLTKSAKGDSDNRRYLKVMLENTSTPFEEDLQHYFSIVTEKVNERCFFGVEVRIESELLCPYQIHHNDDMLKNDIEQLNYLYRNIKDYGIGHLCSVDWKVIDSEKWVKSEFIPSFEIPAVEPIPRDKNLYIEDHGKYVPKPLLESTRALEFKWLSIFSDTDSKSIISQLYSFVDIYGKWISNQQLLIDNNQNSKIGVDNLAQCKNDYDRMRSNIELLLDGNDNNILSFRLMNSAMFIQLWHTKRTTDKQTTIDFYKYDADDFLFGKFHATWRPFQLAFILLNLDGIFQRSDDPQWTKRNDLVDLVWFPTGGGKTEAYLGIIALTIINRRRNEEYGDGTTAIMRYTLRLLATQQFQRAMRLILALEQLRRWGKYNLGKEEISIGLYVGEDSLPNNAKNLWEECLKWKTIENGRRKESKVPLDRCPCCEKPLSCYNVGTQNSPIIKFRCDNINCTFSDELPVKLCDEYIYKTPPTLLFGTVDKFAALGHKVSTESPQQDSRRLFGRGKLNNLPPSLIIQDELHLLLGPLGSAVSLFECAIDQLCTYRSNENLVIRPKIISSTATTRNTNLQIRALYDRAVNIFPKPGISYDDSFFSFYQREKINGVERFVSKRKYIGILPTGRTQMTTQMRLIATMFVHRAIFEHQHIDQLGDKNVENTMDFYHSVIDYFNSLKEVGKADAQFYTEFTKYTRRLFKRVLRYSDKLECLYGYDSSFKKSELTGRLSGAEVVKELEGVSKHWRALDRLPHQDEHGLWVQGITPPDIILATNMISVGLDIERFNTIVMNSMPRNIAEYIQASSRVARNKQGLVVTLHNPFRARDLSHFERFKEFHEKLYYYVEPISITPFSKKSVSKYLPLYLATMIRHHYQELSDVVSAASLTENLKERIILELSKYFKNRLHRNQQLSPELRELLTSELEEYIEKFIQDALYYWKKMVDDQTTDNYTLRYSGSDFINNSHRTNTKYKDLFLAQDAYENNDAKNMWSVPMSLRTVESESVLNVKDS